MRNTTGKTRKERKAERHARKQEWLDTLPKYYTYEENVSKAGKVYYPTKVSRLVNPNRGTQKALFIPGIIMFEWVKTKLGLLWK